MADFYVILFDLTTSMFEKAAMEMTSSGSGTATWTVYASTGYSNSGSASFNSDYYANSERSSLSNLFTVSNRTTAMVRASSSVATSGFLRQWSSTHAVGLYVPPSNVTLGTTFHIPSTENVTTAKLLIGNPSSSSSITVYLYYGNSGSPDDSFSISTRRVEVVTLSNANERVRLYSTDNFFVQMAVEMNSEYDISFVLPQ